MAGAVLLTVQLLSMTDLMLHLPEMDSVVVVRGRVDEVAEVAAVVSRKT